MGQVTGIEWCHHTYNPWIGCTKVGPCMRSLLRRGAGMMRDMAG